MSARVNLLAILRELREKASFENCGLTDFEVTLRDGSKFAVHFPFELPCTADELTNGIRESTRIYRESWILPLIDDLILWAEEKKSTVEIRRERCI